MVAHLMKKEFKAASHLFTKEIYPAHVFDPFISPSSFESLYESTLSHLLSTTIAAFSNVAITELSGALGVDEKQCEALVVRECSTNNQWLIDDRRQLLVRRKTQEPAAIDVFERLLAGLQQSNLQAIMSFGLKDSFADLGASGERDARGTR